MLPGYKLYSFAVGTKHVRSFSVRDVTGLIADYALGECGAPGSPLPDEFYRSVRAGADGVELLSHDETKKFAVSLDNSVVVERTASEDQELTPPDQIRARAEHLIEGALLLLKNPNLLFLGMVWDFVRASTRDSERFNRPAAQHITKHLLKVNLLPTEHPSEVNARFSFRKQLEDSWLYKGINDFANISITVRDQPVADLWPPESKPKATVATELPRITTISVDIQRVFDPRRPFDRADLKGHWEYSQKLLIDRIIPLLLELGFGEVKA